MVMKSLVSFMSNLGYELNETGKKVGGEWRPTGTVFCNQTTGNWKTVDQADRMMIEYSLKKTWSSADCS